MGLDRMKLVDGCRMGRAEWDIGYAEWTHARMDLYTENARWAPMLTLSLVFAERGGGCEPG
jgi:hypothetical protein